MNDWNKNDFEEFLKKEQHNADLSHEDAVNDLDLSTMINGEVSGACSKIAYHLWIKIKP